MEIEAFERLEQKIEALITRVETLRRQNQDLQQAVEQKDQELNEVKELLSIQDSERDQVRLRLEALVEKIESVQD